MIVKENEITRLKEDILNLKRELAQKDDELKFFINTGKALTSSLSVNEVLRIIIDQSKQLINCNIWLLYLLDDATGELHIEVTKSGDKITEEAENTRKKPNLKVGEGCAGWVAQHKKPLLVENAQEDPRALFELTTILEPDIKFIAGVPIIANEKIIGVLEMGVDNTGSPFDKKTIETLQRLADHAAIAIEKASLYQKMEELSITDDLTKLFNIRYMDKNLEYEIKRCQRYSSSIGSIFLDMDFFKEVNDNYGHRMGSKVLKETADILRENLRNIDIIARFGGDEFVVILPETSIETTRKIAERLREGISKNLFLKEENLNLKLTASFGVSAYPAFSKDKIDLIDSADKAMYVSKNNGKNKVTVSDKKY